MLSKVKNKFLWPSEYLSFKIRLLLTLLFLTITILDVVHDWLNAQNFEISRLVAVYMVTVIACYLFDKELPIGTISFEYEPKDESSQFSRLIIVFGSLIIYGICLM